MERLNNFGTMSRDHQKGQNKPNSPLVLSVCLQILCRSQGYARGEAVIAAVFKTAEGAEDVENRLANFVSGFVNQDGRSASLTVSCGNAQSP